MRGHLFAATVGVSRPPSADAGTDRALRFAKTASINGIAAQDDYSTAVSDRSVNADTITNSVVVTGDGAIITATFGNTGARLDLWRRQVRTHDRRRPPRPDRPPRELDLFRPDSDALPFQGRQDLLTELLAWLDDPAELSVHALIGQAGSGKTRLAIELCRAVDPPDGTGVWRAAFIDPRAIQTVVDTLATRAFIWDRPHLLVLDYAATAHGALGRWLDALARHEQVPKLRFLILEREAPEGFGWWDDLTRPGGGSMSRRTDLFLKPRPDLLPGLTDVAERRALLKSAQSAAHGLRGGVAEPPSVPAAGADAAFDRMLAMPRFGNPLNLVMAGVIAYEQTPLGALALRRLDAALHLAKRELDRLERAGAADAIRIPKHVIRHMAAFNGLAGGLPADGLPTRIAVELSAWGTRADAHAAAGLLAQEFPVRSGAAEAPRLSTSQPDLIGEAMIVLAFEGEPWLPAEAAPTVRRAYAIGQTRAAEALVHVVQDFAFALEERGATPAERARGTAVMSWLTELAAQTADPADLVPLIDALPVQTPVLREAAAELTARLAESMSSQAEATTDPDNVSLSAALLNNLSFRLRDLGRREDALAAAAEAVHLYRALAETRPDAFTPDLATSLNNLATMLSDLGRREDALAAAEEAVGLYRALADSRPDAFTPDLAMSLNNLATMLSDLGRREDALAAAAEAVHLRRALADSRPDAFTPDLATSLNNLATMLSDLGRREDALAAAAEAVHLRRALADSRPDAFTPDLAGSLNNLANRLSDLGRREDALAAAAEAVHLRRALADSRPDAFNSDLAQSLWVAGDLRALLGDLKGGIDALASAIGRLTPLFDAYPAAFGGMMSGVRESYVARCAEADREPDEELLAPVTAIFQRLQSPPQS
jgi:tetratricopeptide (TPR) repeat protein